MIKVLQAKQHDVDSVRAARADRAAELAQRRAAEHRDAERVRIAVQKQRDEARARREAEAAAKVQ
jgi:hypothetical protein